MTAVLVALGGGLGAVLRFVIDAAIKARVRLAWPVATFVINVVGSFGLGALTGLGVSNHVLAFLGTGVCGGFTTFSTASVETLTLLRARRGGLALAYAAGMLLTCYAAFELGTCT